MIDQPSSASNYEGLRIPLGVSKTTGRMCALTGESAVMGVLITGAIGAGKTSWIKTVINGLLSNRGARQAGALIINVKDDYGSFVRECAERYGQQDRVVHLQPGGTDFTNILVPWLSAHKLGEMLVSATQDDFSVRETFWRNSGIHLASDIIALLRLAYGDDQITMTDVIGLTGILQAFVNKSNIGRKATLPKEVEFLIQVASSRIDRIESIEERRAMQKNLGQYAEAFIRWCGLADRTFSSISGTLSLTLSAFEPPEVSKVLSARRDRATFGSVREILDEGKIVVVDFSPQRDGLVGKMAGAVLKRQLYAAALATRHGVPAADLRPVYLIADECQAMLNLDDGCEADHNFSALARSLRVGLVFSSQSLNAVASSSPWKSENVQVLLRNLRSHVMFRQDSSDLLGRVLSDRGLPPAAVHCLPNLKQFHALVSCKGNLNQDADASSADTEPAEFDQIFMHPFHRRNKPSPSDVVASTGESAGDLPAPIARWLQDVTADTSREDGADSRPAQCLLVSADAVLLREHLRGIDENLRGLGFVTVRISAEDLDHIDPLQALVEVSGFAPKALARSAVIIDELDRAPGERVAGNRLRRLLERRSVHTRVPGVAFDFSRIIIVASAQERTGRGGAIGFRPSREASTSGRSIEDLLRSMDMGRWNGVVMNLDEEVTEESQMEVEYESR